jgi:hypothetical protein
MSGNPAVLHTMSENSTAQAAARGKPTDLVAYRLYWTYYSNVPPVGNYSEWATL